MDNKNRGYILFKPDKEAVSQSFGGESHHEKDWKRRD